MKLPRLDWVDVLLLPFYLFMWLGGYVVGGLMWLWLTLTGGRK